MDQKINHGLFTAFFLWFVAEVAIVNQQVGEIYAENPEYQLGARLVLIFCLALITIYTMVTCGRMFSTRLRFWEKGVKLTPEAKWAFSGLVCARGVVGIGMGALLAMNSRYWGLALPLVDLMLMAVIWWSTWPKERK